MKEIGIHELYDKDPEKADYLLWGRITNKSRRGFLKKSGLAAMGLALGADVVFANQMPGGLIPALFVNSREPFQLDGKHSEMTVLNDRPWNIEAPPHLLDDNVTPADKLFVRNNGIMPPSTDIKNWTLTIEGESVKEKKSYTIKELQSRFENISQQLTIECGGNGRSEFNPPAKGNQWTTGAVGCPVWNGIRLKDVLQDAGVKADTVYIGYYGKDIHLSNDPSKVVISRGVPIQKAMEAESMIAWGMNGKDLPEANGFPLRLVFGGWPASTSGKWLERIVIRNKEHDGPKMGGQSYRVPCNSVPAGAAVPDEEMCIIESMPVKSLITYPKSGALLEKNTLAIRGHAWAGDLHVTEMHYSIDFGSTWHKCTLQAPANRMAWQHWSAEVDFPKQGYYEVWAKATDSAGIEQPMVVPGWNPRGYLNNACHRIAVKVVG